MAESYVVQHRFHFETVARARLFIEQVRLVKTLRPVATYIVDDVVYVLDPTYPPQTMLIQSLARTSGATWQRAIDPDAVNRQS